MPQWSPFGVGLGPRRRGPGRQLPAARRRGLRAGWRNARRLEIARAGPRQVRLLEPESGAHLPPTGNLLARGSPIIIPGAITPSPRPSATRVLGVPTLVLLAAAGCF